ncbi:MAG: alkaline phosphatase family protein [Bowdeniella nasicola]|nr:alkaline phosphatase family protein [Bowdeniella nasicola]
MSAITLPQVLSAAAYAVGYRSDDPRDDWARDAAAVGLPPVRRAVVVLIDGMGYHQLDARRGHIPFLRRRLDRSARTVFPSTTACAITSLATGRSPGETGMVGYTVRDPHSGQRVQMLHFNNGELSVEHWQVEAPITERVDHGGGICSVGPRKFSGTGLTLAAWRGIREVFAEHFSARVDSTIAELNRGTRLVYLYWSDLDHTGHHYGWQSEAWTSEIEHVDANLAELARRLPADTALIITADHGMVDVHARSDIREVTLPGLEMTAGEGRLLQFFFTDDDAAGHAQERLAQWADGRAVILSRAEQEARMGPVSDHVRARLGNFAVAALGDWGVFDSQWATPGQLSMVGEHGSITPEECDIPLILDVS